MSESTLSRMDAVSAVREAAFTIGDEYEGAGRQIVHCFLGMFGADWDLADIEALIERADDVGWANDLLRHDLSVLADGKRYRFDVRRVADSGVK